MGERQRAKPLLDQRPAALSISTQKTRTMYPNNKSCISKHIKARVARKRDAFRSGDRVAVRNIQKELNHKIWTARRREKLQKTVGQTRLRPKPVPRFYTRVREPMAFTASTVALKKTTSHQSRRRRWIHYLHQMCTKSAFFTPPHHSEEGQRAGWRFWCRRGTG